tara:strand:+ start:5968 stop:6252 length:285 start_codon:yes stop_codon:yes gene_type:complete
MTPDQIYFFNLIQQSPISGFILSHFDQKERICDIEKAKRSIGTASSGEAYLLKFFINVWSGCEEFPIDLVGMSRSLDRVHLQIIASWFAKPIYP